MVGDQPVGAGQNLLFAAGIIETNQSVGGGNVDRAGFRVKQDTVDAEHMLVLDMGRASVVERQNIEAAIEIADPEAPIRVRCQRGNIAVAENGRARLQQLHPSEATRVHTIEPVAGHRENRVAGCEELAHFG